MSVRDLAVELAVIVAIGAVLALLGPFGTFAMPLADRLLDWPIVTLCGYAFFRPVIAAGSVLAQHTALPRPLAIGLACGIASFPTTVLAAWGFDNMGWRLVTADFLSGLYLRVLLIGGAVTTVQVLLQRHRANRLPATPAAAPVDEPAEEEDAIAALEPKPQSAKPPFLERLPQAIGQDLLCLENEDHYVRAHTALGSTLILMRLSDAVAELDPIEGARTHRSWWVARSAVADVIRRDRTMALRLVNGLEVPIARSMVPELRLDGWF